MRTCPSCNEPLTDQTRTTGPNCDPKPGDLSVCVYCSAALVFTDELGSRPLQLDDWNALDADTQRELGAAIAAARLALVLQAIGQSDDVCVCGEAPADCRRCPR